MSGKQTAYYVYRMRYLIHINVAPKSAGKVSENKFVRTDSKLRTLDNFLHPPSIISRPTPITAEKPTESAAVSSSDIEMEDVREEAAEVMPEAQYV
jgi:hypothetical protein